MSSAVEWVKKVYIYLFSAIGLVIVIIGAVQLISLGLKTWVLTKADVYYNYPASKVINPEGKDVYEEPDPKLLEEYQKNDLSSRRQRQAATAIAMIVVGAPLFFYHWRLARKELA